MRMTSTCRELDDLISDLPLWWQKSEERPSVVVPLNRELTEQRQRTARGTVVDAQALPDRPRAPLRRRRARSLLHTLSELRPLTHRLATSPAGVVVRDLGIIAGMLLTAVAMTVLLLLAQEFATGMLVPTVLAASAGCVLLMTSLIAGRCGTASSRAAAAAVAVLVSLAAAWLVRLGGPTGLVEGAIGAGSTEQVGQGLGASYSAVLTTLGAHPFSVGHLVLFACEAVILCLAAAVIARGHSVRALSRR